MKLITVMDAAEILGCSHQAVRARIRRGMNPQPKMKLGKSYVLDRAEVEEVAEREGENIRERQSRYVRN